MIRQTSIALLATAALIGCKGTAEVPQAAPSAAAAPAENATTAIKAAEADMVQGYAKHDAAKVAQHYALDARLMSGGDVVSGRTAIATQLTRYFALPKFTNSFQADRVEASGDIGYARGHYRAEVVAGAGAAPQTSAGEYLTVYRRQPDGKWLIVEDMNIDARAPAS